MTLITHAYSDKPRRHTLIRMSRDLGVKVRGTGKVQHDLGTLGQVPLYRKQRPANTDVQGGGKIDKLLAISIQPTDEDGN